MIFATEQATRNGAAPSAHIMLETHFFGKALEKAKPSVSEQMLEEIEKLARRFKLERLVRENLMKMTKNAN